MSSGFLTLHAVGVGTPDEIHLNPDQMCAFMPGPKGTNIVFAGVPLITVRESCEEIHQMLAELLRVTEYVPPFPTAGH